MVRNAVRNIQFISVHAAHKVLVPPPDLVKMELGGMRSSSIAATYGDLVAGGSGVRQRESKRPRGCQGENSSPTPFSLS